MFLAMLSKFAHKQVNKLKYVGFNNDVETNPERLPNARRMLLKVSTMEKCGKTIKKLDGSFLHFKQTKFISPNDLTR